jgi:hypothetical protein
VISRIGDLGGDLASVAPLLRFEGAIIGVMKVVVMVVVILR